MKAQALFYGNSLGVFQRDFYPSEIVGFSSCAVEVCVLQGCGDASTGEWCPKFRDSVVVPYFSV
jgi:hypothetical protein